ILLGCAFAFAAGIAAMGPGGPCAAGLGLPLAAMALGLSRTRPAGRARPVPRSRYAWRALALPGSLLARCGVAGPPPAAGPLPAVRDAWRASGCVEGETPVRVRGVVTDVERLDRDRAALVLSPKDVVLPAGSDRRRPLAGRLGLRLTIPWPGDRPVPWVE